ncbi:MAG: redoxin domain-containing protein [Planctomycetes bacterium]|nr:redoxin domain-containing protein [Planctomycetota bacterium]
MSHRLMSVAPVIAFAGIGLVGILVSAQPNESPSPGTDERVASHFQALDKNRDGKLTREELGDGLFRELNVDGDDVVTLAEAQAEIRQRGFDTVVKAAQSPKVATVATATPKKNAVSALRQGPQRLIPGDSGIGRMVPDLTLKDINGRQFRLSDYADRTAVVVAFTNTSCPISKKYAPSQTAMERQFADQKIQFLFVNPTASDKLAAIQTAITTLGITGPYVRDNDGMIARAVGATHTTDVIVLDSRRTIVYRGAMDDQYGFEYSLDAPRNEYLKLALRSVIDRRPLLVAATEAPGCPLDLELSSAAPTELTFHNRISRILQARCLECHREGGAAPFALDTYENVVAQAGSIRQAIERGVMPPWFAAPPEPGQPSHWANDKSLADREKADLLSWLSHGKPAGDPNDAPLPRTFPEGWRVGQPDHIVQLPNPMPVKATGVMPYQDVIVESGLTEDKWIRAMEIRPTAPEVVHHVLVFLLPPADRSKTDADRKAGDNESDGFFVAYAPGHDALTFAEGFGKRIPAGSRLKFQMHFTPNGTATQDQTRLGFIFTDREPAHLVHVSGIANPKLSIPPGADNHAVNATQTVHADTMVMAFFPHMHLRGKAFRYEALYPDGKKELLLDVPRYDFNWQLSYRLAEPLVLPKGTTLQLTGWFDNSRNNPANPDPTRTVKWGPQTFDEMMLGYVEYYTIGDDAAPAIGEIPNLAAIFQRLDRNQDGKLSGDEMPADWKDRLLRCDADGDKSVTLDEINTAIRRRRNR